MTPLNAARAALAFRHWLGNSGTSGAAAVKRRKQLIEMDWDADTDTKPALIALGSIAAQEEMPPPTDLVSLTIDIVAFRIEATGRAEAWRSIGIQPNTGRDLMARNAGAVHWPTWAALRGAALDVWPLRN